MMTPIPKVWLLIDTAGANPRRLYAGVYRDEAHANAVRDKLPLHMLLVPVTLDAPPRRL